MWKAWGLITLLVASHLGAVVDGSLDDTLEGLGVALGAPSVGEASADGSMLMLVEGEGGDNAA